MAQLGRAPRLGRGVRVRDPQAAPPPRARALIGHPAGSRGIAQLGRAPRSGRGGRRFNSCYPDWLLGGPSRRFNSRYPDHAAVLAHDAAEGTPALLNTTIEEGRRTGRGHRHADPVQHRTRVPPGPGRSTCSCTSLVRSSVGESTVLIRPGSQVRALPHQPRARAGGRVAQLVEHLLDTQDSEAESRRRHAASGSVTDRSPKGESGCSSVGRAPARHAGGRRFKPCYPDSPLGGPRRRFKSCRDHPSPVAQSAEHSAVNRGVAGSSPAWGAQQPGVGQLVGRLLWEQENRGFESLRPDAGPCSSVDRAPVYGTGWRRFDPCRGRCGDGEIASRRPHKPEIARCEFGPRHQGVSRSGYRSGL